MTSALGALLNSLARATLVVGKGGVGKTTCASGIAAATARRGERTLLLSTDPAAALSAVVGVPIGPNPTPIQSVPHLDARQLSAADLRRAFLDRWRDTIALILDRGTYLDREDIDGLVDVAMPGADEVFALLEIAELLAAGDRAYDRIVIDTAPTGHTLRLLGLPDNFSALISVFDAMQAKHRFMVRALTHRAGRDLADEFLERMRGRIDALRAALTDRAQVAAVLVTRCEPVVAAETASYAQSLGTLGVHIGSIMVNAVPAERFNAGGAETLSAIERSIPRFWIRQADPLPQGIEAVAALVAGVSTKPPSATQPPRPATRHTTLRGPSVDPATLVRPLTIVGGKGGVGKTTVACAIAIAAADRADGDVLLVSTDPAPSIADAFGEPGAPWARGDVEHRSEDVPRLILRQVDATVAFARIRDRYQERIDALFDSLIARGVDLAPDRRILRDLMALAPPGIDELYALSVLGEDAPTDTPAPRAAGVVPGERFSTIVVDPAPTGHLIRLLEMPALALDWTHRLMRLLLKYQGVTGLGETAQDLLDFAKQTRALGDLLRDHKRAGMLIVTLDEPVVRTEALRLIGAVGDLDIDVIGVLWNRITNGVDPLPADPPRPQFVASAASPPPVGVRALRAWARGWRRLAPGPS